MKPEQGKPGMKIGFTGTQEGMSHRQERLLYEYIWLLLKNKPNEIHEFHEGDCIGADSESLDTVARIKERFGYIIQTFAHPPTDGKKRAFRLADVNYPPKPYIPRNHDIVDATEILIAAPRTDEEELRSGTWSTIRYAEKQGKRVIKLKR